jgi:hypothetical protein
MSFDNLKREAQENLRRLLENEYPGRGIIVGRSADGSHVIQVYWLMGRSENSRNRLLVERGPVVRTAAADPAKLEDPSLVIYTAMREIPGHFLVSNGDHTDALAEGIQGGRTFEEVLADCRHEPDAPHWTPRIAGDVTLNGSKARFSLAILKADPFDSSRTLREIFHYEDCPPGIGWCVTTYRGNRNPLPSFTGEPYLMPLAEGPERLADTMWNHLNGENRVALAVKAIDPSGGPSRVILQNRHKPKKGSKSHG